MGQKGWVAIGAVAIGATAFAFGQPHRVTAAPTAPARSESEIRSLDIAFYERRIAEDSFSAADRSTLAGLYLQRARETGSYPDYERAAQLAHRSLALRESHNAATYVLLTSALLAKHEFTAALHSARTLYASDTTDASHAALLGGSRARGRRLRQRVARISAPCRPMRTSHPSPRDSRGGTRSPADSAKRRRSCVSRPLGWRDRATSRASSWRGSTTDSVSSISALAGTARPTRRSTVRSPRCRPTIDALGGLARLSAATGHWNARSTTARGRSPCSSIPRR